MSLCKLMTRGLAAFAAVLTVTVTGAVCVSAQTHGEIVGNRVNVRDAASLEGSSVLYMVDDGQALEVTGVEGDYYQVNIEEDEQVYIASEYVAITQTEGFSLEDACWVYDAPDFNGEFLPIGLLDVYEPVTVLASCIDWYAIEYHDSTAFVEKRYIDILPHVQTLTEIEPPEADNGEPEPVEITDGAPDTDESLADEIIEYAKTLLGARYSYGSMSPSKGFDCSGFVTYVLKNFDISVSRSSASMAGNGVAIDRSELQKGDLIFFATSGGRRISHVGMYIGDGQFIHSSTWGEGVVITSLGDKYYSARFVKATRIL